MNAQDSRKLIVAISMAAVVGVGVMTYAMRPHPVVQVAQAIVPPAPLAEIPPAPAAVAPLPEVPAVTAPVAAVPPVAVAPTAPAHKDVVVSKRTVTRSIDSETSFAAEPSVAVKRRVAAANSEVSATYNTVTPKAEVPDLGMTAAAATVATAPAATAPDTASTPAATPAPVVPAPALAFTPSPSAAADLKVDPTTSVVAAAVATDSQITSEVKSAIAVDNVVKDVPIGVSTTNGVVALTGSLASQDAVEHVKIVVASVKDVKSVDTSALIVRNL